jgi:hypothetical protein
MSEEKPKRKYVRRRKVEPLAVYSVVVTVRTGRKSETIYGESVRTEGGCLVVVSMDGPPPLVEKTRYIPLGSAEIEVCQRPAQQQWVYRNGQRMDPREFDALAQTQKSWPPPFQATPNDFIHPEPQAGPRLIPGPLEIARQRAAAAPAPPPRNSTQMVERNADGVPVVTAGFLDGSPV